MQYKADSPEEYIEQLPIERQKVISKLRATILNNLPQGFEEQISYGMLGYVVPHTIYASGYHVNPELPLPFMNLASQKNYIALYHSGLYADKKVMEWFLAEYSKNCKHKLDMGKSCVRFKKLDDIPYGLIGELCKKISVSEWIDIYQKQINKS